MRQKRVAPIARGDVVLVIVEVQIETGVLLERVVALDKSGIQLECIAIDAILVIGDNAQFQLGRNLATWIGDVELDERHLLHRWQGFFRGTAA